MDDTDEQLPDKILGCFEKTKFDNVARDFAPEGSIDNIINRESILKMMNVQDPTQQDDDLVTFILGGANKVFAIAISIGLEESKLQKAIKIWSKARIYHFFEAQWKFLAPVFSAAKFNHDLEPLCILPFVSSRSDGNIGSGTFGKVFKYKIHPRHFVDPDKPEAPCPAFFAVKEFRPSKNEDRQKMVRNWELELGALMKMNTLNQEHIVKFITAFRCGQTGMEDHYLILEYADGENPRTVWKTMTRPCLSVSLVKETIVQLHGLAKALRATHYLNSTGASYRHGDLKPENILCFKDGSEIGTLKICDWGLAKEHNIPTELRTNKTTTEYGTRRYEAPEVVTGLKPTYPGQTPKRRSRLYDIWAVGCISLEFMIWLLYGLDTLDDFNRSLKEEFSDNSPFYQTRCDCGKVVASVHKVVAQCMAYMAEDPVCQVGTTALGDLLELVRDGLLVVDLPRRMGSNLHVANMGMDKPRVARASTASAQLKDPTRILATEFQERLGLILAKGETDRYWCMGVPRPLTLDNSDDSARAAEQDGSGYYTDDTATYMSDTGLLVVPLKASFTVSKAEFGHQETEM